MDAQSHPNKQLYKLFFNLQTTAPDLTFGPWSPANNGFKPIKYLQWSIVMKGYYFVLVKYISGRCAIVDRQYSTYGQALAAAKRRMRRRAIVEAYIYQQMSIQDVQPAML